MVNGGPNPNHTFSGFVVLANDWVIPVTLAEHVLGQGPVYVAVGRMKLLVSPVQQQVNRIKPFREDIWVSIMVVEGSIVTGTT